MFKKIKERIKLHKYVQLEIVETLVHICQWMSYQSHFRYNPYSKQLESHCRCLMSLGDELRKECK